MDFKLDDAGRAELEHWFGPRASWKAARASEGMRSWQVLRESAEQIVLQHGGGAVARLLLEDGRVAALEVLENEAAEAVVGKLGFPVPDELRRKLERALRHGQPIDAGLDEAVGPGRGELAELERVYGVEGETRLYRYGRGAFLRVMASVNGKVLKHEWLSGVNALDLMRLRSKDDRWAVTPFSDRAMKARTRAVALDVLAAIAPDVLGWRVVNRGRGLEVLARTPDGVRLFTFERGFYSRP